MPLKTFIIYAHEDQGYKTGLEKFLRHLVRRDKLVIWTDKEIRAGEQWDKSIKLNLNEADVIIILISVDFYNSDYIQNIEFKKAKERYDRNEALLVPILVRHCPWRSYELIHELQMLPSGARSVDNWQSKDEAYTDIAEHLERLIDTLLQRRLADEAKPRRPNTSTDEDYPSPANNTEVFTIKAPIVGTFYRSPGPEDRPYVKVGDKVNPDTIVCMIEAMKLFTEIEAEVKGKVVKVLVDHGNPVEFDQPLFIIEKDPEKPARPEDQNSIEENPILLEIRTPMVGTVYLSPSPEKSAYVKPGDKVKPGTVVCIIEAMKLFNEIESEINGKIVKVLVKDADPVEYDQPLFLVDPT